MDASNLCPFTCEKIRNDSTHVQTRCHPKWKVNLVINFLKKSNALITLTEFEADQFRKVVDESKVKVIPHPIDCDFFSPKNKDS